MSIAPHRHFEVFFCCSIVFRKNAGIRHAKTKKNKKNVTFILEHSCVDRVGTPRCIFSHASNVSHIATWLGLATYEPDRRIKRFMRAPQHDCWYNDWQLVHLTKCIFRFFKNLYNNIVLGNIMDCASLCGK